MGFIEPLPADSGKQFEFVNAMVGNNIPASLVPAVEKGFLETSQCGGLIGHPVVVRGPRLCGPFRAPV